MYSHRWTAALLLAASFATQSTVANAEQPRIGVAASVVPNAEVIIGENSQKLSAGSELYGSETVRTGNRGTADLVFIDSSNLRVGASSELVLDKFVLDPIRSSGVLVSQATRGMFRIATGSQDSRVNTPYGTLGLLGTHELGEIQSLVREGALAYAPSSAFDQAPSQAATPSGQRSVVEMVLKPPGERRKLCRTGRPPEYGKPCPEDCEVVLRLVEGAGATYQHKSGKVANLTGPNSAACFTATGQLVLFTSTESILSFTVAQATPPPSGGVVPSLGVTPIVIPPVVSPTTPQ